MTDRQMQKMWIKVEEANPTESRWYPVTTDGYHRNIIRSAFWDGDHWYGNFNFTERIIAWSPLEPYKGEVTDDTSK